MHRPCRTGGRGLAPAGLGAEARIGGNWLARVEYLHYDFGKSTAQSAGLGLERRPPQRVPTTDIVRAGRALN